MAIIFPSSPSLNDLHKAGGTTYKWDGSVWRARWQEVSIPTSPVFNIDDAPTSPNAFDDEFNSTTLDSKWVSITGGTPAATWAIRESCITGATDNSNVAIYQPISGSAWKIRACVHAPQGCPTGESGIMLSAHNTANDYTTEFGHWHSPFYGFVRLLVLRWTTNMTVYSATPYVGSSNYDLDPALLLYDRRNYWELELASGSLIWKWSNTGYTNSWRTIFTEPVASHLSAITHVGIHIQSVPGGVFDWIRRVA